MKNHRFLWLRNRTTNNRKCEKARNIKEKRTIEMFNTVSKQLVALRSSASANLTYPRDNFPFGVYICQKAFLMGRLFVYPGILCSSPGLFTQEFRI